MYINIYLHIYIYIYTHMYTHLHSDLHYMYTEYLPIFYIVFISPPSPWPHRPQVVRTRFQVSPFAEEMVWEAILGGIRVRLPRFQYC